MSPTPSPSPASIELKKGYMYALGAYLLWGFFPLYWHLIREVPSSEILCHRIIWSFVFYVGLLKIWRSQNYFKKISGISAATKLKLISAALIISFNWLCYIYAVTSGHVLESSLGYFINPLVSVFLGYLILGEKLNRLQWTAVALAFAGVAYAVSKAEGRIWISLVLALSFGLYGLIRKTVKVDPLIGSSFETMVLIPLALGYLAFFHVESGRPLGFLAFDLQSLYLILGGVVTGLPLWWFTEGAVRIPLSTLGFLQYIAPTFQFLTAVAFFHEYFGRTQIVTFGLIWLAILVYIIDLVKREKPFRRRNQ
jgi:chloramphenicol-sensitive protein RarD